MARNDNRVTPEPGEPEFRADFERDEALFSSPNRQSRPRDPEQEGFSQPLDGQPLDEDEPQFLRAQKRVPVRKGSVTKKTANRIRWVLTGAAVVTVFGGAAFGIARYGAQSWRFRLESSDNIETAGLRNVSRTQIMDVLGADIGRNLFKVPLQDRKSQLEDIPWVESATVMRLLPDRLRVQVVERTPVAFVRMRNKVSLIDGGGVVMEMPGHKQSAYSFPVITGMTEADPLSMRAARMKIFSRLVTDLNSTGGNYSKDLSEVEITDPEDVKITVEDPQGALVVHLGGTNFLSRYQVYLKHIQEWRQQFNKLESVDLRYNGQIIVNPEATQKAASKP